MPSELLFNQKYQYLEKIKESSAVSLFRAGIHSFVKFKKSWDYVKIAISQYVKSSDPVLTPVAKRFPN